MFDQINLTRIVSLSKKPGVAQLSFKQFIVLKKFLNLNLKTRKQNLESNRKV